MAGTLKKQLTGYERVAVNIASRFVAHRNEQKQERVPHEDYLLPPIPLNLQSPKPVEVDWHGRRIELAKVTCRYGSDLRIIVWMQDNKTGKWPVLLLEIQIDRGGHEAKTDICIEGVELYYLLCGTLHMPLSSIAHERSGPFEGCGPHRIGGEDFRVRRMEYIFPNHDTLTTEGIWEWPSPGDQHIVLFEHPVHVDTLSTAKSKKDFELLKLL